MRNLNYYLAQQLLYLRHCINMSMKKFYSILLLVFIANSLRAQEDALPTTRFGATIVAGFNASQIDGDDSAGFNKVGINAGLKSDIFLTRKTEINVGILFSQRGSRPDTKNETFLDEFIFGLSYIQVPVLFTFKDWYQSEEEYYRVRAFAGLSFGRLVSTRLDQTAFDSTPELLQKNSLGFHFGAGYSFTPKMRVVAEFMRDIIPLYNVRTIPNPIINTGLIIRTVSFTLEYSL